MQEPELGARRHSGFRISRTDALQLLLVAAAYYGAAEIGLRLALVGRSVTPLWPPTGVALVALLMFGRRVWPAIAVAALAVNAPISPSLLCAAAIAVGNTIAPLVAATMLVRSGFRTQLDRVRDAVTIVVVAILSMSISATIGSLALVLSDAVSSRRFGGTWSVWWTGDAMGVLIVAPFLWSMSSASRPRVNVGRVLEAVVLGALLLGACLLAFGSDQNVAFVILPLVGWAAWRFQQPGAASACLVVSTLATIAAAHDAGPFAAASLIHQMVTLQSFNAAVAFTSIFVASAVTERERLAQRDHRVVEVLQRSLLPQRVPEVPGVAVAARYLPASPDVNLGGDWYDLIPLLDGRLGVVVGDIAGHGVAAAAAMGQLRMALRACPLESLNPAEVLGRLNSLLRDVQPTAMATVWYGLFDPATQSLSFSSAGHPPPLQIDDDGVGRFIEEVHGSPLGALAGVEYELATHRIDPRATLLLYTDGLIERRHASIDDGFRRLRESVLDAPRALELLCDHVVHALVDASMSDDVALLAIRPTGLTTTEFHLLGSASPAAVREARKAMRLWLERNAVAGADAIDVLIATTEAHVNAMQHAYGLASGDVAISATIKDGSIRIIVRDLGSWQTRSLSDDGRGLTIMRAVMDAVEIDSSTRGTEVRMHRTLTMPDAS